MSAILYNTGWRARHCPWKFFFFLNWDKINFRKKKFWTFFFWIFLAYITPWPPLSVHKKCQPNRSSRLAGYRQHIYIRMSCLIYKKRRASGFNLRCALSICTFLSIKFKRTVNAIFKWFSIIIGRVACPMYNGTFLIKRNNYDSD